MSVMPAIDSGMTIDGARRSLARRFTDAGIEGPALDARILVGHALGLDHVALVAASGRQLTAAEHARVEEVAVRRIGREPVARILGVKEFWGLPLRIAPAVFDPRPDTETLVRCALRVVAPRKQTALLIADLGTGSGALLLALLTELPDASGIATDRSPAALEVARGNALQLGLAKRAAFVAGDFGAALGGGFDLVVSNPPYVETAFIEALAPEVRNHEPRMALDGGPDGLAPYRAVAAQASRLLAPGGCLLVEIGAGQEKGIMAIFEAADLSVEPPVPDLGGIPRVILARAA